MANWEQLYPAHREEYRDRERDFNPYDAGVQNAIRRASAARIALEGIARSDGSGRSLCDRGTWKKKRHS